MSLMKAKEGPERAHMAVLLGPVLGVAAGQGVRHGVEAPGAVFDGEVEAEQLADPLVLRNGRQALVQEELEAVMVSANKEVAAPQIRAPVAHSLHQTDELLLISRELEMARGERPAEECERASTLVENGAKPHAGCVAVHHESLSKSGI